RRPCLSLFAYATLFRSVAHEVLAERGMIAAGPHRDGDIEPLPPLDAVWRHDPRRVLRIEGAPHFLVLGGELLFLPSDRGQGREKDRKSTRLNSSHASSP